MSNPDNPPATQGLDFQSGTEVPDSRRKAFPAREKVEPRVVIETAVFDELLAHGRETTSVELCGVLVGSTCRDDAGPYLTITGSIRGKDTRNEGAQVTFTHETWDHIHKEMESRFQNSTIVGWYHTHPGFGIFLSDMDKFIQDYFFNQPFQVALVIDPISSKEGLFAWIDGKTRPLTRCWIGKDVRKLACGAVGSAETRDTPPRAAPSAPAMPSPVAGKEETETYSNKYISLFSLALAFFIGVSLTLVTLRGTLFQAALTASRAETRELLGTWASDTAAAEELRLLHARLAALAGRSSNIIGPAGAYAISGASFATDLDELCNRVEEIASSAADRRARIQKVLTTLPAGTFSTEERSEQLQNQMMQLRAALGESLLIQLAPYLGALAAGSQDETRMADAKRLVRLIIELNPSLKSELKQKIPGLVP